MYKIAIIIGVLCFANACSIIDPAPDAEVIRRDGTIFIKDQTGKEWDVTHAVNQYGFDPNKFDHGLGPTAISPIQNPVMIHPGQSGYPSADQGFTVLGTEINGNSRAYPLDVLIRHEIANERFTSTYVAVAY
jgi:hypothetical protein